MSKKEKKAKDLEKWEKENNIISSDTYYKVDEEKKKLLEKTQPWKKDRKYFTNVKMSSTALLKIAMHAATGEKKKENKWLEVMGLLMGFIDENTFIITDSFALITEGATESNVGLDEKDLLYMQKYIQMNQKYLDRKEIYLGWYHSHPGYKAFLSGTDVLTQRQQQLQGATLAVVIDPRLTSSSGKVEIGAFRTYEEGYKSDEPFSVEEMGHHGNEYYRIPNFEFFKSSSDNNLLQLLWNKYWANTLSTNSLINNKTYHNQQMVKIVSKLEIVENDLNKGSFGFYEGKGKKKEENENSLEKITNDSIKLGSEILQGLSTHVIKDTIFN